MSHLVRSADRRFRQDRRLRRRQEFQQVYNRGIRAQGRFMTVFLLPRKPGPPRLGIAATKKLGGAVERNRAKRVVREIFRQHSNPSDLDIVVIPRRSLLTAAYDSIRADYVSCVDRPVRRHEPAR